MPPIVLAAVLAATPAGPAPRAACANALVVRSSYEGSLEPRRTTDLPPPYLMRAVLRQVGGCSLAEVGYAPGRWANVPAGAVPPTTLPARAAPVEPSP